MQQCRPLNSRHSVSYLKTPLKKSGPPDIRFHNLRHSCASLPVAQGLHPRIVMEQLGHSTIKLTMDTYSHVLPELQSQAADTLDGLFGTDA